MDLGASKMESSSERSLLMRETASATMMERASRKSTW